MINSCDNKEQQIGFRIWDENKSAILLYLLDKSTTWTIPSIQENKDILETLSDQLQDAEIMSAVCIINAENHVPIREDKSNKLINMTYQYIVYDVITNADNATKIKFPNNVRASHFMRLNSIKNVLYRAPILTQLIKHMQKEEEMG